MLQPCCSIVPGKISGKHSDSSQSQAPPTRCALYECHPLVIDRFLELDAAKMTNLIRIGFAVLPFLANAAAAPKVDKVEPPNCWTPHSMSQIRFF